MNKRWMPALEKNWNGGGALQQENTMHRLIQGDCLQVMATLEDNSVDAVITDPPYELGFMGKGWDSTGIAYNVDVWRQALRVLKPGGHLLAFGGTRTYHRMACAIEDAGFEVRDMVEWVYGSGFPKSLNIGKAVDKLQGNEREVVGEWKPTGTARPSKGGSHSCAKTTADCGYDPDINATISITKGTSPYEGYGTALKPAHEPICLARKPLSEKNVALNVLKWGTGGINVDATRIECGDNLGRKNNVQPYGSSRTWSTSTTPPQDNTENPPTGRFPANLIHDGSDEVQACFPDTGKSSDRIRHNNQSKTSNKGIYGKYNDRDTSGFSDSGNASRYFKSIIYTAKASRAERNAGCEGLENEKFTAGNYSQSPVCKTCDKTLNGTNDHSKCSGEVYYREMKSKSTCNNHPTVKSLKLMEYLITMIAPPTAVILDPFTGSGTTGVAACRLGRDFIGIELDPDYMKIAQARIQAAQLPLFEST